MPRYKNYWIDLHTKWKENLQGLPLPPKEKEREEWIPVPNISRLVPWGYKKDPDDPDILLPIPEELELLEKAKTYLKHYSLRNVAHWLSEESGRKISAEGLRKRVKQEKFRANTRASRHYYERLYKKAAEKAREIDRKVGANKVRDESYGSGDTKTS